MGDGYCFKSKISSHYFHTDSIKHECVIQQPRVMICNQTFNSAEEIMPILELISSLPNKRFVLFCNSITGEALTLLALQKIRKNWNVCAVNVESSNTLHREKLMADLSVITQTE